MSGLSQRKLTTTRSGAVPRLEKAWKLYVDKGDIQVTAGEQTCRLRRGQLIFHAPGEFHAFSNLGTAPDRRQGRNSGSMYLDGSAGRAYTGEKQ